MLRNISYLNTEQFSTTKCGFYIRLAYYKHFPYIGGFERIGGFEHYKSWNFIIVVIKNLISNYFLKCEGFYHLKG